MAPSGLGRLPGDASPLDELDDVVDATLPRVSVVVKVSPTFSTRCPGAASARLSLPSHAGCRAGSAIHSKMSAGAALITRDALTTFVDRSSLMREANHRDRTLPS